MNSVEWDQAPDQKERGKLGAVRDVIITEVTALAGFVDELYMLVILGTG